MPLAERIVKAHVAPPLAKCGFHRLGRSSVWVRDVSELRHLLRFEVRRATVSVQWGVLSEAVLPALWDQLPPGATDDVAFSAMTGWLNGVPGTVCPVAVDLGGADEPLLALSDDLATAGDWLAQFSVRLDLVHYLLAEDEPKDRRGFLIPTSLPLKLTTCAFLLDADRSREAGAVAARALSAMERWSGSADGLVKHRLGCLREVAERQPRG